MDTFIFGPYRFRVMSCCMHFCASFLFLTGPPAFQPFIGVIHLCNSILLVYCIIIKHVLP